MKWYGETIQNDQVEFPAEKRVIRYIHKSNKVLTIASLDITTGIFTTSNPIEGTYTAGNMISMLVSYPSTIPTKLFSEWNGTNEYQLEYITSTTFYVYNKTGASRIGSYAAGQNIDVTQFQFEYITGVNSVFQNISIDVSGITLGNDIRTVLTGVRGRAGYSTVQFNTSHDKGTAQLYHSMVDGKHFMPFYAEQIWNYNPINGQLVFIEGRSATRTWGGSSWAYTSAAGTARTLENYGNLKITSIQVTGNISNGTICEIHTKI